MHGYKVLSSGGGSGPVILEYWCTKNAGLALIFGRSSRFENSWRGRNKTANQRFFRAWIYRENWPCFQRKLGRDLTPRILWGLIIPFEPGHLSKKVLANTLLTYRSKFSFELFDSLNSFEHDWNSRIFVKAGNVTPALLSKKKNALNTSMI